MFYYVQGCDSHMAPTLWSIRRGTHMPIRPDTGYLIFIHGFSVETFQNGHTGYNLDTTHVYFLQCADFSKCLDKEEVCNGEMDCEDASDELKCPELAPKVLCFKVCHQ